MSAPNARHATVDERAAAWAERCAAEADEHALRAELTARYGAGFFLRDRMQGLDPCRWASAVARTDNARVQCGPALYFAAGALA